MSHQPHAQTAVRGARSRCVFCGEEHDTRFQLCPECTKEAARTRKVQGVREEPDD
jgi:ribosomal protein S14